MANMKIGMVELNADVDGITIKNSTVNFETYLGPTIDTTLAK